MNTVSTAVAVAQRLRADFTPTEVLRSTDKTVIIAGEYNGTPAVAKVLTSTEPFWAEKFAREISAYTVFARGAPPVRVPRLLAADADEGVLLIEHMAGHPLSEERYPSALPIENVAIALNTLKALAHWEPAPDSFTRAWNYTDRLERYRGFGLFRPEEHRALTELLGHAGPHWHFAHGDALPVNIILSHGRAALLDWEYADYYLPALDFALLWIVLRETPGARDLIAAHIDEDGMARRAAFTVNRAMLLARELRTHRELPEAPWQKDRLRALAEDWDLLRADLNEPDHPSRRP
ncbi:aminoglycoside phosphotransferase family protein [Actinospica robiniae]|uniref:aminoglycoside phosphotransferase family protein n=1 Tax=Actinospica robiniae TaxID=304901 RepID=UPI000410FCA7|nr:aminoglycoside phosphotransferase family protein [Actinospica robiniae]